ncbi:MAG: hypothetical protein NPINA01_22050 [Nitrospinaceae bacterium]|nr:MAG: hypothetical protein NPINA01_22050 [Nitrospinaceae bacterium]
MATKILSLTCSQCGALVVQYKKQGSGALIQLIIDRIQGPPSLVRLKAVTSKSELPSLTCPECGFLIGVPMNHEGKSLAYRLVKGSFRRQIS